MRTNSDQVKKSLRPNLDRCAVGDQPPQFLDLGIREGDAAVGPVTRQAAGGKPVGLAVDEYLAAGRGAALRRVGPVLVARVGYAQAQVIGTRRIARVDRVAALG